MPSGIGILGAAAFKVQLRPPQNGSSCAPCKGTELSRRLSCKQREGLQQERGFS